MAFSLSGDPFWLTTANERSLRRNRDHRASGDSDTIAGSHADLLAANSDHDADSHESSAIDSAPDDCSDHNPLGPVSE